MPFGRLSIKSALRRAQNAVTIHSQGADRWYVRSRLDGEDWRSEIKPRLEAKIVRRERRVFAALRLLEVDTPTARTLAVKVKDDLRDWRKLVASYVAEYDVSR